VPATRFWKPATARKGWPQLDKAGKVNLIVSDVNMPNMDGITFLTQVKQHPRHKFAPVIMLTTEGQDEKKEQGRAAGAKAWIVKPFNPPQLLDAVSKLILPRSPHAFRPRPCPPN
jgi:two-component system chemotaxis response regulator CheY